MPLKQAGVATRWPLVLWRDPQGFLKACACSDRRAWPFIEDDLGVGVRRDTTPDVGPAPETPTTVEGLEGPPVAADTGPGTQPYPKLEEILPAPEPRYGTTDAVPVMPVPPAAPTPAPQPARPSAAPRSSRNAAHNARALD